MNVRDSFYSLKYRNSRSRMDCMHCPKLATSERRSKYLWPKTENEHVWTVALAVQYVGTFCPLGISQSSKNDALF